MRYSLSAIAASITFVLVVYASAVSSGELPAFPGASGGGAAAIGGRGGSVIEVTNLNDAGPGSLRAAVETEGPRTIVFKVGGTITLETQINIRHPYLTIAGQTAPGDGILIRSAPEMQFAPLTIENSHDIIIRYIRVRPGPYANEQAGDSINTYIHAHNIIIDHCSLSWSTDENTEVWTQQDPGHSVTWSWNIIAEGLNRGHLHSCGLLAGSNDNAEGMHDISVHHNLFAHNDHRNPLLKVKSAELVNNIIYGWGSWASAIRGGVLIDVIGNKYVSQLGISSTRREFLVKPYYPYEPISGPAGNPSIYFEGNIGPNNSEPQADAWHSMLELTDKDHWGYPDDDGHADRTDVPEGYRRLSRRTSSHPISVDRVGELDNLLLGPLGIGASMRLDEHSNFVPNRCPVDQRIINEYLARNGIIPDMDPDEVGGYPVLQNGTPYPDRDHDGMPDSWEQANGLDPDDPLDRNNTNLSSAGYTNLELFLNGTTPDAGNTKNILLMVLPGVLHKSGQ